MSIKIGRILTIYTHWINNLKIYEANNKKFDFKMLHDSNELNILWKKYFQVFLKKIKLCNFNASTDFTMFYILESIYSNL